MKYTVVWKPDAEDELARLWQASSQQGAISAAADQIDRVLGQRPLDEGESRGGSMRVIFLPPLGVFYHVSEDDRLVSVLRVWQFD